VGRRGRHAMRYIGAACSGRERFPSERPAVVSAVVPTPSLRRASGWTSSRSNLRARSPRAVARCAESKRLMSSAGWRPSYARATATRVRAADSWQEGASARPTPNSSSGSARNATPPPSSWPSAVDSSTRTSSAFGMAMEGHGGVAGGSASTETRAPARPATREDSARTASATSSARRSLTRRLKPDTVRVAASAHFSRVMTEAAREFPELPALLRDDQLQRLAALRRGLSEFERKRDYRYHEEEGGGEEQRAPRDTLLHYAGTTWPPASLPARSDTRGT